MILVLLELAFWSKTVSQIKTTELRKERKCFCSSPCSMFKYFKDILHFSSQGILTMLTVNTVLNHNATAHGNNFVIMLIILLQLHTEWLVRYK